VVPDFFLPKYVGGGGGLRGYPEGNKNKPTYDVEKI